jgi:hypothetical protein
MGIFLLEEELSQGTTTQTSSDCAALRKQGRFLAFLAIRHVRYAELRPNITNATATAAEM